MNTQATFQTYQQYREWLNHWRRLYRTTSSRIISIKDALKHDFRPAGVSYREAQSLLVNTKMAARSLMMARSAVDEQYHQGKHNQQAARNVAGIKVAY